MSGLVIAALAGGGALVGSALLAVPRPDDDVRMELSLPPDLVAEQVETFLGAVAGLPARARVTASVDGAGGRLAFGLRASGPDVAALRAGLQGFAPGVRLTDSEPGTAESPPRLRARVGWRGMYVLLRGDQREMAVAALLGVVRGVGQQERLRLSVRLRPVVRPKAPPYAREPARSRGLLERVLEPLAPLPADQLSAIRSQYGGPLLNVRLEVLVWAASRGRARQLLAQVAAVLRSRSGVRGRFSVRAHRWALAGPGTMLAPPELVPLLAWPLAGPDVPGLTYNRAPQRLPDESIPVRGGRCWGVSTWPGMETRELHQPVVGALSHTLILGPSGTGKSNLLAGLLLDDVRAGRGVLLIDMKGDTAIDALGRVPEARQDDVVIVDPADGRPVPGLKGLAGSSPELMADLWVGLFRSLFADSWGIRTERYLRLGVQTLAQDQGAVITELGRVFQDVGFRRRLVARAQDPLLEATWASFESLSAQQQAEHLAPLLGKAQDVINRKAVRGLLGQAEPKMTIAGAMRAGKIVIVRLSPGPLGLPTAQLLGGLIVYELYQAVMARQQVPAPKRRPFGVYVDEPKVMGLAGVPLDALYELARGMGVGITTATQSVSQLPTDVQNAVLLNAATIATFRTGYRDAQVMARELPGVDAEQLQHLGRYEIVVRIGLTHGHVSTPTTAKTPALPDPFVDLGELRTRAAERYGVAVEETDRLLKQRRRGSPVDDLTSSAPIGRRRRAS